MYVTCVCRCLTVRSFLCLGWFWTLKQIYKSPEHQEETQVWTVRWSGAAVTLRSGLTGLMRLMRGRVTGVLVDWLQVGDRRTNRKWYDFLDLSLFPLDTPDVSVRSTLKLSVVLWFSVGGSSGSTCSQKQLNFFNVWSSSAAGSNRTSDLLKHTWRWSGWSCSCYQQVKLSADDSVSYCEPSESVCHIFHLMMDIKTPTESLKQPSVVSASSWTYKWHSLVCMAAWCLWGELVSLCFQSRLSQNWTGTPPARLQDADLIQWRSNIWRGNTTWHHFESHRCSDYICCCMWTPHPVNPITREHTTQNLQSEWRTVEDGATQTLSFGRSHGQSVKWLTALSRMF